MSKSALQQVLEDAGYECQSDGGCLGVRVSGTLGSFFANFIEQTTMNGDVHDYDVMIECSNGFRSMCTRPFTPEAILVYFPDTKYSEAGLGEEGLYQVFVVAHADDWHVAYEGTDENEARKVFDAYVGSNSPVDLILNRKTILTHEDGKVWKPEEGDDT